MTEVELTINARDELGREEHVRIMARGSLADALRSCVLRAADRYAGDPDMQRLADAIAGGIAR